jgi:hypothetical protein
MKKGPCRYGQSNNRRDEPSACPPNVAAIPEGHRGEDSEPLASLEVSPARHIEVFRQPFVILHVRYIPARIMQ